MEETVVRKISAGLSQKGVRNHNERLLLSLLQRHGDLPGSDLSRLAGLSPPTVSAILRRLENDGILERGEPVRGKVGKPSSPMRISPNGAFSYGLKIGRRSASLLLMDITGVIRHQRDMTYAFPVPADVFSFLRNGIEDIKSLLSVKDLSRICGIGVAAPFEMWNWRDQSGKADEAFKSWEGVNFRLEIETISTLPVTTLNDATAACQAEHIYGRGKEFRDYAYFFVGTFMGGGVVLNHSVFEGRQGNAGALGSMRSIGPNGESMQLVDTASMHLLEARLREVDLDPALLWVSPQDWTDISRYVEPWLGQTAQELAKASLSTCSVIDFEAILIDGAFPAEIRHELVERVRRYIANQDTRGLIPPQIESGNIGGNARAIGAASGPIFAQYFLNTNAGLVAV
ncbi:ROK family transcriptional regulator [Pacificibacter marinus]|uniref:N-acetylmannosamine kinase n=1 Tax=Pacificibacter marinus TaxID=658057 RepID=A0A1Y5S9Q1_9RHOB|nr:ROK family transcriptional regulator [Pacificibacter marinus]SEK77357.1 transcriptional regulator, MarR family [Pacificibacter marinus]SLN34178.1 N-acetylmannosamine kinase [Pacificibacter marinus]